MSVALSGGKYGLTRWKTGGTPTGVIKSAVPDAGSVAKSGTNQDCGKDREGKSMMEDANKQSGSSPTLHGRGVNCPVSGKRSFTTETEAVQFEQQNRQKYRTLQQYPFACEDCPAWHLTTNPPGTASMARTYLPTVPESKTESRHTGPKGIETAEVVRLRSSGMTLEAIATRLGVSIATVKYHLDKTAGKERTSTSSVISLDEITRKKAELEAQLTALTQTEERLPENARMKVQFVGDNIVIKKNGERVTISLSDANNLVESLREAKVLPA